MIVIGLMSGTSADGVDAAIVRLNGAPPHMEWQLLAHIHRPHTPQLRSEIFACFRPETSSVDRLCRLNFDLGEVFGATALEAIATAGLNPTEVNLIGSHGQTVWHIPPESGETPSTLQIGEAAVIAERTGLPVVSNFRTRDMAAGGHGAPLVPLVDWLLLSHSTQTRAAQNIGGIGNVTYLPASPTRSPEEHRDYPGTVPRTKYSAGYHGRCSEQSDSGDEAGVGAGGPGVFAFDTGPGNMLIDDAASRATEGALTYDKDGRIAAQGQIDQGLLASLLADPYFSTMPPKTTGRERFGAQLGAQIWMDATARGLSAQDILATLTAFTSESIGRAYHDFFPVFPDEVILSGGGAYNLTLKQMLAERLKPARLMTSDEIGIPVDAKEALVFAILAYETWHHRPGNLPAATGATRPVILGNITLP